MRSDTAEKQSASAFTYGEVEMLYDLQVSRDGLLVTDLTTSSLRRVTDRAIEVEDRGELYRVMNHRGEVLGKEFFTHDYRTKGRIRRKIRSR